MSFLANDQCPGWRKTLVAFFDNPTKEQFELQVSTTDENQAISAKFIINEALRLYPPTRRVHRAVRDPKTEMTIFYAADIDACHRDLEVWGPDALNFLPGRWVAIHGRAKSFFPFGSGEFTCPAKAVFGLRIIAILVGALIQRYGDGWLFCQGQDYARISISEDAYLDQIEILREASEEARFSGSKERLVAVCLSISGGRDETAQQLEFIF
ncbi:hypothetical protein FQN57_006273 [Myotisia sp. PD_48]|nr:hypothetical protein FQN57_006273 [Myotisia sp. PD_48]